jgi:hypothetical protein
MGDFAHSQPDQPAHGQAHAALQGLPDERTAQRLLDVLTQLEHTLANARPLAAKASTVAAQPTPRQQQALVRLDGLIAQLEAHLAGNGVDAGTESPAA